MDWNKAIQYAQLVNAAYNVFLGNPSPTPGFDVLETIFANDLATDASRRRGDPVAIVSMGLILQAQGSGEAVVAIRGTEGIKEWVQDAQFGLEDFKRVPGGGQTEDGFTDMYKSMTVGKGAASPAVINALPRIAWKRPVTSLVVCGHSLGGALATLLALDVAVNAAAPFRNPVVYTYASPRTGDSNFATKYAQTISTMYRFVDNVDLVPKLPMDPPYKHVCAQIELDSLTLIPPRVRLQPNPVCWHILSSYIYLMSLYAGGPPIGPEAECAPGALALVRNILNVIEAELKDEKSVKDKFTASPRRRMGGN